MKRIYVLPGVALITLLVLSGCASFHVRPGPTRSWWIEGKPFPVEITVTSTEKVSDVRLTYTPPGENARTVPLHQSGNFFSYTIPGEEMVAGTLRYTISYRFKGKGKSLNTVNVTVLTRRQAKERLTDELASRVAFTPPSRVPVIRDVRLELHVRDQRPGTTVTFYRRTPGQASYRETRLTGSDGLFTAVITSSELRQGYNTYYFRVTEEHPDVGELEVFAGGRDGGHPYQFDIMSTAELKEVMAGELYDAVSHTVPGEVPATRDLELALRVDYPPGSFIHEFSGGELSAQIRYRSRDADFKRGVMSREGVRFRFTVPAADLQAGYDSYYFVITDQVEEVGPVTVEYPAGKELFSYHIMSFEEVRAGKAGELFQRISHQPVEETGGISDLVLQVAVADAREDTTAVLHYRKDARSGYRSVGMVREGELFEGVISARAQREGYTQYYFEVTETDPEVGTVTVQFPEEGRERPIEFTVLDLKQAVLAGIDFSPLPDVEPGDTVEARAVLRDAPEGTRLFLRYRPTGGELEYRSIEMHREGSRHTALIPQEALEEGTRIDYYLLISAGGSEFTYPDERVIPLYFHVREKLVEEEGERTVFGTTARVQENMLEGRIFRLGPGTNRLPQNMHRDFTSLLVLYTRRIDIPPRRFTEGFPGLEDVFEWFGVQYRGWITVREGGTYRFRLHSDDGSKLFIDSTLVIDNDKIHPPRSESGEIYLSPGTYPIRVDYFQGPRDKLALQLFVTRPGGSEQLFDLEDFE